MNILHYFYDPYCGWCYGAAPLLDKALKLDGVQIEPHGIGMLSGAQRQPMTAEWRDFVRPHEKRITSLSGQVFSSAYLQDILERRDIILDSNVPIAAMLSAMKLDGRGVEMLEYLQIAYYQKAEFISDRNIILKNAQDLGYELIEFGKIFDEVLKNEVNQHIINSSKYLEEFEQQGVPKIILEHEHGVFRFHLGKYLSNPELFESDLIKILKSDSV